MDEPRERPHMSLIYIVLCPSVGGVAGVSTMTNLGRSGDATVSLRDLAKPTAMSGFVYDIL